MPPIELRNSVLAPVTITGLHVCMGACLRMCACMLRACVFACMRACKYSQRINYSFKVLPISLFPLSLFLPSILDTLFPLTSNPPPPPPYYYYCYYYYYYYYYVYINCAWLLDNMTLEHSSLWLYIQVCTAWDMYLVRLMSVLNL